MKYETRVELQELSIKAGGPKSFYRRLMERHNTKDADLIKKVLLEIINIKEKYTDERLPEPISQTTTEEQTTEVLGSTQTANTKDARNSGSQE